MQLRSYWYIACPSSQLGGSPRAVRVLDLDLVVFRDGDGRPRALADRCCHRGVKLSLGRVTGGQIACGYHGWRFDGRGACAHIPSLREGQRIPAGCAVPSFPCEEQDGYVWVWPGSGEEPPSPPPAIADFDRSRWVQGTIPMACDSMRALENNLDWCHPAFAHPWTHGQFYLAMLLGVRQQHIRMAATPDGLVVQGPVTEAGEPLEGRTSSVTLTFRLPCRADVEGPGSRRIVMHFVPTGPESCRIEWLSTSRAPLGPRVRWVAKEPAIFRQDRVLLESATPAYAAAETWSERSVEADAPTLLLRRIVGWAARGEWDERRASQHGSRVLEVRS